MRTETWEIIVPQTLHIHTKRTHHGKDKNAGDLDLRINVWLVKLRGFLKNKKSGLTWNRTRDLALIRRAL